MCNTCRGRGKGRLLHRRLSHSVNKYSGTKRSPAEPIYGILPEIFYKKLSCHGIDLFHVFHIELLEHADRAGIFITALKSEFMDLLIIKVKSKFMQADRHLDRTEKVLHCLDSCQGGLFEIKAARDIEYVVANCAKRSGFTSYTYLAQLPQIAARPAP